MRTLTINIDPDARGQMLASATRAEQGLASGTYQGEFMTYESYGGFLKQITEGRLQLLRAMLAEGTVGVRELARRLDRDVRRVHDDSQVLVEIGLLEKDAAGALSCPFDRIHVDIEVRPLREAA